MEGNLWLSGGKIYESQNFKSLSQVCATIIWIFLFPLLLFCKHYVPLHPHQALLFSVDSECKIWAVGWRVLLLHVSTFYHSDKNDNQGIDDYEDCFVTFSHSESKSPETQAKQMSLMSIASCSAKVAFTWVFIGGNVCSNYRPCSLPLSQASYLLKSRSPLCITLYVLS